jgi:hypothetical protein
MKKWFIISLTLIALIPVIGFTQAKWDSNQRKNVIKFNPTPMLIWGDQRNITISYERLIKRNMSVALQVGYLLFPKLTGDTIAKIISLTTSQKYGVNIAADYRYYPMARNRRSAPDGLYIGGYLSYYGFNFKNNFEFVKNDIIQNGAFEGKLRIGNLGFELGYQFLFWKRVSLDLLLFGPSISYYSGTFQMSGSLDQEEIDNIDDELVNKLLNRFPLLKTIFSGETLKFSGTRNSFNAGLRYSIQLGIAF